MLTTHSRRRHGNLGVTAGAPPGSDDDWAVARLIRLIFLANSSAGSLNSVRQELAASMTLLFVLGGLGTLFGQGLGYLCLDCALGSRRRRGHDVDWPISADWIASTPRPRRGLAQGSYLGGLDRVDAAAIFADRGDPFLISTQGLELPPEGACDGELRAVHRAVGHLHVFLPAGDEPRRRRAD